LTGQQTGKRVDVGEGCWSEGTGPDSPCANALRLDLSFPAAVLGPVLRCALRRLAAICFSEANRALSS
jgi:hypothetical protein